MRNQQIPINLESPIAPSRSLVLVGTEGLPRRSPEIRDNVSTQGKEERGNKIMAGLW